MAYRLIKGSIESLYNKWTDLQRNSSSNLIFSTPEWTGIWWKCFGNGYSLFTGEVCNNSESIGISPLMIKDDTAFLTGNENICDYLDFIVLKDREKIYFDTLIAALKTEGIKKLELVPVREDSTVMTSLVNICKERDYPVAVTSIDVSPYVNLPGTWEEYLQILNTKQRHELRRKMRRLQETGKIEYTTGTKITDEEIGLFFKLFRESREDKAEFLTEEMENFLKMILNSMAELGYLRFNTLSFNSIPIAITVCFDYNREMLLYNSGFDRQYDWLSAGVISKAMAIEDSIDKGKLKFDFLRGNETYKYRLGGLDLSVYKCTIILN